MGIRHAISELRATQGRAAHLAASLQLASAPYQHRQDAAHQPLACQWEQPLATSQLVNHPTMAETVTIAHLTDMHLGPIAGFTPRYWNLKRALGYLNWVRKRRYDHLRPVLDRLVADLLAQAPQHIAAGGDLCNIGLPKEHAAGLAWLESLGSPQRVSVVPGNHDIYCALGRDP